MSGVGSEPRESDLVIPPPGLELLDAPIGEVHRRSSYAERGLHQSTLLLQVNLAPTRPMAPMTPVE